MQIGGDSKYELYSDVSSSCEAETMSFSITDDSKATQLINKLPCLSEENFSPSIDGAGYVSMESSSDADKDVIKKVRAPLSQAQIGGLCLR